jgi:DeoR/GlpR family transcriptional regulator of sugar metabolism
MTSEIETFPPAGARSRKAELRQRAITERVLANGSISAQELAAEFGVSIMTIHRDLHVLQRRGVVRKFHGGVTAQPSGVFESQLDYRLQSHTEAKSAIARVALEHVEAGMSVMLDDSTTILHMLPGFTERAPLHVATTFMAALRRLAELTEEAELTVIGIGGVYDSRHDTFVGMQCLEQIGKIRPDALFMSTSAVANHEAFHQDERMVAVKRAMLDVATRKYLLVDHTKIGRVALHRVASLAEFDCIITDSGVDPAVLATWDARGIRYELAP